MVVLAPIQKKHQLVLKRFNNDHFSRSHESPFPCRFGYCLGRNVTSSMLAQPKKISICPRAQKIQLCNIFRGRMDHYLGEIMALIRD